MKVIRLFTIVTCVLLTIAGAAFGLDQSLTVSGSLTKLNRDVKIAVNTKTGDALAVWCQADAGKDNYGRIYAAVLTRNADGSYTAGTPFLVSPNSGSHQRPSVAYNPIGDDYGIVWDTGPSVDFATLLMSNPQKAPDIGPTTILFRSYILTLAGPPAAGLGELQTLVDNEMTVGMPFILPIDLGGSSDTFETFLFTYFEIDLSADATPACSSYGRQSYGLGYTYFPCRSFYFSPYGSYYSGNYFTYNPFLYNPYMYTPMRGFYPYRYSPSDPPGEYTASTELRLVQFALPSVPKLHKGAKTPATFSLTKVKDVLVGECNRDFTAVHADAAYAGKKIAFFANGNDEGEGEINAFKTKLGKPKNYGSPIKSGDKESDYLTLVQFSKTAAAADAVPPGKSAVWAVYRKSDGRFATRNMKTTGKPTGKEKKLFDPGDNFAGMDAAAYGGDLLMAWVEKINSSDNRIKLQVCGVK
jgi:hypothetical protein